LLIIDGKTGLGLLLVIVALSQRHYFEAARYRLTSIISRLRWLGANFAFHPYIGEFRRVRLKLLAHDPGSHQYKIRSRIAPASDFPSFHHQRIGRASHSSHAAADYFPSGPFGATRENRTASGHGVTTVS
jgi:hypothetical protein